MLIVGLGFFLYLLKTGEINTEDFSIKKLQGPVYFEIDKNSTKDDLDNVQSQIKLIARNQPYLIYSFIGTSFSHIPKSEYYKDIYRIPLEASDAVTGTWLGTRYIFYVIEIKNEDVVEYHIFETENTTDSTAPVVYKRIKIIEGFNVMNTQETY
ncbi:MAG: hypothetical protein RJB39_147 [Candidatus Parcubacteria bacterium]|jgi:hypothetical protein